jgi:hypothetical protein
MPAWAVEASFRLVRIGGGDRGAQVVERQVVRRERLRVRLNAHGRTLAAGDADEPHARELRDLGGNPRVGELLDLRKWRRLRREREDDDGRVAGLTLL